MTEKFADYWKSDNVGNEPSRVPDRVVDPTGLRSDDVDRIVEIVLRTPANKGWTIKNASQVVFVAHTKSSTPVPYNLDDVGKSILGGLKPSDMASETSSQPKAVRSVPDGLMIDLLVPAERAEDMLLTLQEAFEERWLPKYGLQRARYIFTVQSVGAVIGYYIGWAKQHLSVLKFLGS